MDGGRVAEGDLTGFAEARVAGRDLDRLRAAVGAEEAAAAAAACRASADPDGALAALLGAVESRARLGRPPRLDERLLSRLVPTLAGSRFLARAVAASPRLVDHLRATPWFERGKPPELLRAEAARAVARARDEAAFHRALRRFRAREMLRIAARDLAGRASLEEIGAELSALAAAALDAAAARIVADLASLHGPPAGEPRPAGGLAVLGMGKLGAGELNFSSDVDLVLVYAQDGETAGGPGGALTHRQFFARAAERLTRALGAVTADGFVFRMDLNLRPGGRSGPIVESFEGTLRYYEAQGRTWERAALLRARPVAGDLALGEELLRALAPFVYRRSLDLAAVEEIRAMKGRIDREAGARDLKLGPGGIREVEFVVAAMQLLHAGRDARLRERGTLPALDRLLFAGLLPARDRDALAAAYLLLRRAENRIQALDDRQTHQLPADPAELGKLALRLGLAGPVDRAAEALVAELAHRRDAVAAIFGDLLGTTGAAPRAADPRAQAALDPAAPAAERRDALAALGFADPEAALAELSRLSRRADTPFAEPPPPPEGEAERLLAELSRTPDPDQALAHLAAFASALSVPGPYFALLAGKPAASRLLLQLFGTSDFLSKYFLRHPELLDALLGPTSVWREKGAGRLLAEARARLAAKPVDDLEGRLSALRRFKNEETLRIGLADVSGSLDLGGVAAELTALGDACIAACLDLAAAEAEERWGRPGAGATLSVIGLGKLGGRELGYHSDLDLIFLHAPAEAGAEPLESEGGSRGRLGHAEYFTRLAQRLIAHLQVPLREGALYQIDTRLRPSGTRGALVVSLAALAAYHRREAALWERQALLKARHVAGDAALFARAEEEVLVPALFRPDADPAALGPVIAGMRQRMEAEASGEGRGEKNPKTGYGGLVDVEFAVQYLQLLHGAARPEIRTPSTPEAISRLGRTGLLAPADERLLAEAYRYLRRLELRLRIVHDYGISRLPPPGRQLSALARRLGHGGERGGESLLAEYARVTAAVREAFRRIVGVP